MNIWPFKWLILILMLDLLVLLKIFLLLMLAEVAVAAEVDETVVVAEAEAVVEVAVVKAMVTFGQAMALLFLIVVATLKIPGSTGSVKMIMLKSSGNVLEMNLAVLVIVKSMRMSAIVMLMVPVKLLVKKKPEKRI